MKTKILFFILITIAIWSCQKERISHPKVATCNCIEETSYRFEDIMQKFPKTNNEGNKMLLQTIRAFVKEHSDLKSETKKMANNLNSDMEYNFGFAPKTLRDDGDPDTISVYIPNMLVCDLDSTPIFAISETLPDSFGEDRIWGYYLDDHGIERDVIMSEEAAKTSIKPVLIFDTRFSIYLDNPIQDMDTLHGQDRSVVATGDKFFISRVKSSIDLDNDNNMEVSVGEYVWSNFLLTQNTIQTNVLNIADNQIGQLLQTWIPIPHHYTGTGPYTPHYEFPFTDDKYISMIVYDNDWGASAKWVYLYPPAPYSSTLYLGQAKFKTHMSNSSTTLIAWTNYKMSLISDGWYQDVNNCPNGEFWIHHWNN